MKPGLRAPTAEEQLKDLEDRVAQLEGIIGRLTADQAVGGVLYGPFRLPYAATPDRAFQ